VLRLSETQGGRDVSVTSSLGCDVTTTDDVRSTSGVVDDSQHTEAAFRQRLMQVTQWHNVAGGPTPQSHFFC